MMHLLCALAGSLLTVKATRLQKVSKRWAPQETYVCS